MGAAQTSIYNSRNSKSPEVNQYGKHKKHSVFDDLQDGSKQKSVVFLVYDCSNPMVSQVPNQREFYKWYTSENNGDINVLSLVLW